MSQVRRAVRKRLAWGILVFIFAGPAAVGLAVWKYRPYYRAEATLRVNPIRPRILYRTDENTPSRRYADFFATQLAIVKSAEVLNRCLSDPAVSDAPLLAGVDDPVRALRDTLEVQRLERTQLFSVSVRGAKAQGLAGLVNGIVRAYLGYLDEADNTSQNRRVQLLDAERKKLKDDVELKANALAKLRATVAADLNAAPGVVYRDPVNIAYEVLVDIRTRRAPLKARLGTLQAKLKAADVRVRSVQIEEAVDRDPQVQRLTGLRDQLRRELLSMDAEAAAPAATAVQARVNIDLRISALNQEAARRELQLAWLSQAPEEGAPSAREDGRVDVPMGLVLQAFADHPEAQRLITLSAQLRQELASIEARPAVPSAAAVRERLNAEPQIVALRGEEVRKEVELAVMSETLRIGHHSLRHTKAVLDGIRQRLAKTKAELKGEVTKELRQEIKEDSEQRAKELRAQLQSVEERIGPYREHAFRNTKAVLAALRKRLGELEPKLKSEVIGEMKQNAKQRANELRTQLQSVEKQIEQQRAQARPGIVQRLKENARDSVRREIENLKAELAALDTSESALKGMLKEQAKRRKDTDRKAAELRAREEDMARTRQSLRDIEQRLHELDVEAAAPGYISIASYAKEPVTPEPYVGRCVKYSIVAVIAAAGLALLVMILLDRRDDRVWSAEDLRFPTGAELLGCVTHWDGELRESAGKPALLCHSGAPSLAAEEVRNLMAGVLYPADAKPARTLLVTGAAPGDGRTTLAANLAACVAGLGKNVLLIDANFRKPDVAGLFGLGNIPGLGDILAYDADPAKVIRTTDIPCLSVLTAGSSPSDSVGLVGSGPMQDLLRWVRAQYDYVFIDAPPLMLADARVMAPMVDGVVCSFRALASRRAAVHECLATLRRLGARTIGVALIGVNPRHNGHRAAARALTTYVQVEHTPELAQSK